MNCDMVNTQSNQKPDQETELGQHPRTPAAPPPTGNPRPISRSASPVSELYINGVSAALPLSITAVKGICTVVHR